ncbi:MAG: UDP-N-acetylmuramoyl-L-alanyl-D-glutamate--2,6-diaminopimelate ligase [Gammaproteobacteria bacterium]|nr:UDP-N-acetylmuramoyl-L-alanyl-D-glutamate--2,6-diaminopimelate ligase [Gammaproteobacteria bacterium]
MMAAHSAPAHIMLSTLLAGIAELPDRADCQIKRICTDSRDVQSGDLFCALSGTRAQGHDFITHAITAGAAAVVWDKPAGMASVDAAKLTSGTRSSVPLIAVENLRTKLGMIAARFYAEPSHALTVFGVTGTNGKTSCTQFIAHALHADAPCGVIGTLGNGMVDALQSTRHTTPDAVTLQALLAHLRHAGAKAVAMEVSSHGLDQGRVNGVLFKCAVFTNLSRDHLDYHPDMDAYGQAKARLFFMPGLQHAVINADDVFGRWLLSHVPAAVNTISYGLAGESHEPRPSLYAERVELGPDGLSMRVNTPWGSGKIASALLGRFNASNLLAVLGALLITGMPFEHACARVQNLTTVPGRMERYGGADQPLIVVDYAHTPDALQHVLQALREHCRGKLRCVFGCGGDRDRGKRPIMGRIAEASADEVILTNDNPRSEAPSAITQDILAGMVAPQRVRVTHDRATAIADTLRMSARDDVVLIAGKGHETQQIIGDKQFEFNDGSHVLTFLKQRAGA